MPIYVTVGFTQRAQFNQRRQNNDTFHKPSVVNAPCHIGTEQFPDARIIFNYANDKYSQACDEIVSSFRHLAKNDILQPHFTQKDIVTSNKYPNIQMVTLVIISSFLIYVIIKIIVLLNLSR